MAQINLTDPLFLIPAATGPVFFLAGWIMYSFPPKKINMLYGYRSRNSMKDQKHWDFAQLYSARKMMIGGGVLTLTCLLSLFVKVDEMTGMFLGLGLMILMIIIVLFSTEKAMKEKFGRD
jgi:uncharacterized membrane protein